LHLQIPVQGPARGLLHHYASLARPLETYGSVSRPRSSLRPRRIRGSHRRRCTSPSGGSLKLLDFRALGAPHLASDVRGTPLLGKHRGTLLRLDNDTGRGCAIGGCRCLCSWTLHLVSQLAVADETGMKAPTLFTIMNMHRAPRDALLNSMRRTGATGRFWHHMTAALQKFGESPFCALG
jgi:hypothetical protein